MLKVVAAIFLTILALAACGQKLPVTYARTQFISLLNPAFAVTQLDYNRANLSYRTDGQILASAQVHFPNMYTAVGAFGSTQGNVQAAGVHASYHTIFLSRFHLTGGAMIYSSNLSGNDWRVRSGITLAGGKRHYWIAGFNLDQSTKDGRLLPGVQFLKNICLINSSAPLKMMATVQYISARKADVMLMPLIMYRNAWQGGVGYLSTEARNSEVVARLSYRRFGWWHVYAGWPVHGASKSINIECSFQKSF